MFLQRLESLMCFALEMHWLVKCNAVLQWVDLSLSSIAEKCVGEYLKFIKAPVAGETERL